MRISDWSSDVCSSDLASSAPATVRHTLVFEREGVSAARWPSQSRSATILSRAAALASLRAIRPFAPPTDLPHSSAKIASSNASREGVLIVSRSEEHTSELQSLMRISYAVFCLKKTKIQKTRYTQV